MSVEEQLQNHLTEYLDERSRESSNWTTGILSPSDSTIKSVVEDSGGAELQKPS